MARDLAVAMPKIPAPTTIAVLLCIILFSKNYILMLFSKIKEN
jgi:hypothetical protein